MDNISIGTAWLYSQFRAGALTINSVGAAGNLQDAIWYLEGETPINYGGYDGTAFYNAAKTGTSTTDTTVFNDSKGAYGVVALNLYDGLPHDKLVTFTGGPYEGEQHYLNQDVLGIVPEPTTIIAGALLLLPFGASALRIVRKNRAG
jgi:hypothetical protein